MLTFFNGTKILSMRDHSPGWEGLLAALFIVAIYFSTFAAIVVSVLLAIVWLFSCKYRTLPGLLERHSVIRWSLLLYAVICVGAVYGTASHEEAISMIKKYRELFFIPVLVPFFRTPKSREWAWAAVVVASLVSLLISYLMAFGLFSSPHSPDPALKSRITHSILIAFFAYYCGHQIFSNDRFAKAYVLMAILAVYNLFFVVEGRTGQLILVVLAALFAWQRLAWRGRGLAVLILTVFLGLFLTFSNKAERINEGIANTEAFLQNQQESQVSSMGQRLTFWKYSIQLMAEKPLLGHGTGSFADEYARVAKGERYLAQHPHNEFLFLAVQLGIIGLIPYLGFLVSQYREAWRLPEPDRFLLQGIATSLILTSVFNSPLYDHTEGHWFDVMIALCLAASSSEEKAYPVDA